MAITVATFDSYAIDESLGTQAEASGNNQIVLTDDIQNITGNNGNVVGSDYIGRVIILNLTGEGSSGAEQTRVVIDDTAGTGNLRILTVSEDWETNPSTGTSDTVHVFYSYLDCPAITSTLNTRTGFYEMGDPIIVGAGTNVAGLWVGDGALLEIEDSKSSTVFHLEVQNAGRLQCGYLQDGKPVAGNFIMGVNNSDAEAWINFESGGEGRIYDTRMVASVNRLKFHCDTGSDVQMDNFTINQGTEEGHFFDAELKNGSILGTATATEIARVDAGSYFENVVIQNIDTLTTASGDTSAEDLTSKGCICIGTTDYIDINTSKTWYVINPSWGATVYGDFNWLTSTTNYVYDQRSIDAIVQEADGTKLQDALINVYENTQLADLVLETTTDVNGVASGAFTYLFHETNSATTTYGGHALQCGKWLYLPFVATQVTTDFFDGTIVLSTDANIVQTTQATAKTAGASVTWNDETNPSSIIKFTGGSGTLAATDTVTGGTSTADGVVTEFVDGDSTAGTIHLKTRDALDFSGTETLSNGSGWTATLTSASQQDFSIYINAATLSFQALYDYESAIQTETTLTADGELIWEWCRSAQTQPVYNTGSSFYTEQSNSKGIIVINGGSGTVDYFTDDADAQYVPPTSTTLIVNVQDKNQDPIQNAQTSVHLLASPFTEFMNEDTTALGVASEPYTYTGDLDVVVKVRKSEDTDNPRYFAASQIAQIAITGLNVTITLEVNPFI